LTLDSLLLDGLLLDDGKAVYLTADVILDLIEYMMDLHLFEIYAILAFAPLLRRFHFSQNNLKSPHPFG